MDPRQRAHLNRCPWKKPEDCGCRTHKNGAPWTVCCSTDCDRPAKACGGYCPKCFKALMDETGIRPARSHIIAAIHDERERQEAKWGQQNHDDGWWTAILTEEVGEVAEAALKAKWEGGKTLDDVKDELIQVAAVAVSWIEAIERRGGESE